MAFGIKTKINEESRKQTLNDFNKLISDMKKQAESNPISFKVDNINKGFEKIRNDIGETNNGIKSIGSNASSLTGFFVRWLSVSQSIMFSIRQIGEGISFINSINKQSTSIRMVNGMSEEEMNSYVKTVNNMAINLKDDTSSLLDSSEKFLRAGRNIEEATRLTELSTMVSKVSGQTQATTGEQMIQIQNGWKLSTESMMGYMDKLSVLDQKSSSSMAEIATALGRTSASASEVGEKFDNLATYITVVSDVSKKSASSIGESFKGMYSRMTNLKLGNLDEEGKAISDVEKALARVNINLRENETTFRDMNGLWKEVMSNWSGWNDLERTSVANAIAGAHHKENFIILMNNQSKIQEYLNYQAESAGSIQKQYNTYLDSTEAKMQGLKAESQKFWLQMLDSNTIKSAIGGLTQVVQALQWMTTNGKLLGVTLVALTAEFIGLTRGVELFGLAFKALQSFSIIGLLANPMFLVAGAIASCVVAIGAFSRANQKVKEDMEKTKKATDDLTTAMSKFDKVGMEQGIKALEDKESKLKETVKNIKDLKDDLANLATEDVQRKHGGGDVEGKIRGQLNTLESDLKKTKKAYEEEGLAIDENTNSLVKLNEARERVKQINTVENIKAEAEAEWNNRQAISALMEEYNSLSQAENQSITVKTRLSQISNDLKGRIQGLTTVTGEDGVVRVQNIGLVNDQISAFNNENLTLQSLTQARLDDYRNHLASEKMKTQTTYSEVKARVQMLAKEYDSAMSNINPRMNFLSEKYKAGSITKEENDELNNLTRGAMYTSSMFEGAISRTKGVISEIDAIMKSGGASYDIPTTTPSGNPPKINTSNEKGSKGSRERDVEDYKLKENLHQKEEQQLKNINREREKYNLLQEGKQVKDVLELKQKQVELLIQESTVDDTLYNKKLAQYNAVKGLLNQFGFNTDGGQVNNAQERLQQMVAYSNSLSGESKKAHVEQVKDIENEIGKFYDLGNAIEDITKKKMDLTNQVKKLNEEILNLKIDNLAKQFETLDLSIKGAIDDIDLKSTILGQEDLDGQMDILVKRKDLVDEEIKNKYAQLDAMTKIIVTSDEERKKLDEAYRNETNNLRNLQKEYFNLNDSIKQAHKAKIQLAENVESKITDILKKQVDERKKQVEKEFEDKKKSLEDKYKAEEDYWKKIKKLYNDANDDADKSKELSGENKKLSELKDTYQKSLRDLSAYGMARSNELKKQIEDQESKIGDVVEKQERDRYNKYLDEKISQVGQGKDTENNTLESDKKNALDAIDNEFSNANIAKKVLEAMQTGFIEIGGQIVEVGQAYSDFLDKFENGNSIAGQSLKKEFNDNFTEMRDNINDVMTTNGELNDVVINDSLETGNAIKTNVNDNLDKAGQAMQSVAIVSQEFTNGFVGGLQSVSSEINNNLIPAMERLSKVSGGNLSLTPEQSQKLMNANNFMPNRILGNTMPNIPNVSNISNRNSQNMKTEVNLHFGDIKTDGDGKGVMNAIKNNIGTIQGWMNRATNKNLYGTV